MTAVASSTVEDGSLTTSRMRMKISGSETRTGSLARISSGVGTVAVGGRRGVHKPGRPGGGQGVRPFPGQGEQGGRNGLVQRLEGEQRPQCLVAGR